MSEQVKGVRNCPEEQHLHPGVARALVLPASSSRSEHTAGRTRSLACCRAKKGAPCLLGSALGSCRLNDIREAKPFFSVGCYFVGGNQTY